MAKALQFPTIEDRTAIHNIIGHQSKGKCSRDDMMRLIAEIIERYNISKMFIFGYSVRIIHSEHALGLPILIIESSEINEDCPTCHAKVEDARYLRTEKENFDSDYDIVNMNCLECGCVYSVKGNNHRIVIAKN